jgi:hypothetical protein
MTYSRIHAPLTTYVLESGSIGAPRWLALFAARATSTIATGIAVQLPKCIRPGAPAARLLEKLTAVEQRVMHSTEL